MVRGAWVERVAKPTRFAYNDFAMEQLLAETEPDDEGAVVHVDGIPMVGLAKLIELKLASGLSNPRRAQDLADVIALIDARELGKRFAARLDRSVRAEFRHLVDVVREHPA